MKSHRKGVPANQQNPPAAYASSCASVWNAKVSRRLTFSSYLEKPPGAAFLFAFFGLLGSGIKPDQHGYRSPLDTRLDRCFTLTLRQRITVKIVDQPFKQAMPVDLGLQMHEDRTKPDRPGPSGQIRGGWTPPIRRNSS